MRRKDFAASLSFVVIFLSTLHPLTRLLLLLLLWVFFAVPKSVFATICFLFLYCSSIFYEILKYFV